MTFDEYQVEALRTASSGKGPELEMCIRALGLCGEAAEFALAVHIGSGEKIKEAGDVLWYAAALADSFGLHGAELYLFELSEETWPREYARAAESLQGAAGALAELVKKHVGHGKPADLMNVAGLLRGLINNLQRSGCAPLALIARENVAKLRARYPAGWDLSIASMKPDGAP